MHLQAQLFTCSSTLLSPFIASVFLLVGSVHSLNKPCFPVSYTTLFFIAKCLRRLSLWCALPLSPILFHLPLSPPILKRQMRARWTDIWSGRKIKTGRNRKKKGGRVREGNRGAGKGRCVGEWGAAAKASQLEESEEQGDKEDSQRAGASKHPEERHWYPPLTPQYHSHHHHQHHLLSLFPFLPPLSASSTPLCSVSTELRLSGRLSQIS